MIGLILLATAIPSDFKVHVYHTKFPDYVSKKKKEPTITLNVKSNENQTSSTENINCRPINSSEQYSD
jgi:hypothetical protein